MLKKPIIINNWQSGMKLSALEGFSQFRGIDPYKMPGTASIDHAPVALTGATLDGLVNWTVIQPRTFTTPTPDVPAGTVYFLTGSGKLYKTTDYATLTQVTGNTTTNGTGNGMVYWKGCIWIMRNQYLDYYDIDAATWHNGSDTGFALTTAHAGFNPLWVGQDDVLYIGHGQFVSMIQENSLNSFVPSTAAGVTFTNSETTVVLRLPKDYTVSCFAELGNQLMPGTQFGTSAVNTKVADIFPWDRNTAHGTSLPIRLNEEGINAMIVADNTLYVSAGYGGTVYVTNGVSASTLSVVPLDTKQKTGSPSALYILVNPDAMEFYGSELLLGVSQGSSSATKTENPMGVYSLYKGAWRFLGVGSHGKDGSDGTRVVIGSIYSVSPNEFFVGWQAGSSYGVDYYGPANNRVSSYGAYMYSQLYPVSLPQDPDTVESFNIFFKKPLVSGDGLRLSYRTNESGTFKALKTIDYATYKGIDSFYFKQSLPATRMIQFKIELTATSTTTPELIQIIVS